MKESRRSENGMLSVVRAMLTKGDDAAGLEQRIAALKAEATGACVEIERLQAARLAAPDYAAAVAVDEELKRQNWVIESAAAKLPELEARLKAAQAERQRHTLARHIAASRNFYPKLRDAIRAAARVQGEAIALREAAIAEIGEHAATLNLPVCAYLGLVLPDSIDLWIREMDRVFATAPAPEPRVVPVPATTTTSKTTASKSTTPTRPPPAPAPRPKRQPRLAAEPADGEITLMFLRPGVELDDGTQSVTGDVVNLPAATARELVRSGAADFVTKGKANG